MPRGTRQKKAATPPPEVPAPQFPPNDDNPAELFILPEEVSKRARIVLFPHPVDKVLTRFLFCPDTGFYEFTDVAGPRQKPSSCLLAPERSTEDSEEQTQPHSDEGCVIQDARVLVATPIDALFLMMPLFQAGLFDRNGRRPFAQPIDGHLQQLELKHPAMARFLYQRDRRKFLGDQIEENLTNVGEIGGETFFRPNTLMLFDLVKFKALNIVQNGLPPSLEAYAHKLLQVPTAPLASNAIEKDEPTQAGAEKQPGKEHGEDRVQKQSERGIPDTEPPKARSSTSEVSEEIMNLLRLRIAVDYITINYFRTDIRVFFEAFVKKSGYINFKSLDEHMEHVHKLRSEARALRSLSDNISRKRSSMEDDEAVEARAEKKRKKEEDEKRKKAETRAAKELKKVDTTGMMKLSSFFVKATPKK